MNNLYSDSDYKGLLILALCSPCWLVLDGGRFGKMSRLTMFSISIKIWLSNQVNTVKMNLRASE